MNALNMLSLLQKSFSIATEKDGSSGRDLLFFSAAGIILTYVGLKDFKRGGFALLLPAGYMFYRAATTQYVKKPVSGIIKESAQELFKDAEPFEFSKTFNIKKDRGEIYHYWRQLENLPNIMTHVAKIEKISKNKYHWEAEFGSKHYGWNADITEDIPNEKISWKSTDASDVENEGSVEFRDSQKGGTDLKVTMLYKPARTELGKLIASILNPVFVQKVKDDLREFKHKIEKEEITI